MNNEIEVLERIVRVCEAHYQPLIEAKDVEIFALKAALEKAMAGLARCADSPWHDTAKIACETINAINAEQEQDDE